VQLYDRVGKNKLGARRTRDFDLSDLANAKARSRGLPNKDFGECTLDIGLKNGTAEEIRDVLESIARELSAAGLDTFVGLREGRAHGSNPLRLDPYLLRDGNPLPEIEAERALRDVGSFRW
jgi:hypothetical protein